MGIEFNNGIDSKIYRTYKKAITGDYDAIKAMCDYYDSKENTSKSLEWLIFGAHQGYADFMQDVCIMAVVLQCGYPEDKRQDLLLLGLYWANKLKETLEETEDSEKAKRIIDAIQGLIGKNVYNSATYTEKFKVIRIPMI